MRWVWYVFMVWLGGGGFVLWVVLGRLGRLGRGESLNDRYLREIEQQRRRADRDG